MTNGWTGGQYSVYRILMGVWLLAAAVTLMPSADGMQPAALLIAIFACLPLIAGWYDRVAAAVYLAMIVVWLLLRGFDHYSLLEALWVNILLALPVLHLRTPAAPFWSLAAMGRDDPGNEWHRPARHMAITWCLLSLMLFVYAIVLLRSPFREKLASIWTDGLPTDLYHAAVYPLLIVWLALLPLAPIRTYRHWLWLVSLVVNVIMLSVMGWPMLAAGMAVFHLAAFDPAWLPRATPEEPEPLFYDGYCGLCHRWVRFVLAEDVDGKAFVLSPLQGDLIKDRLTAEQRENLPDSIVVQRDDGAILTKSAAILHILDRLGGLWRIGSWLGRVIPGILRDTVYDGVAAIRHRLFKKPKEACPMMPEPLRGRFKF